MNAKLPDGGRGHLPIGVGADLGDILAEGGRLSMQLIAVLSLQRVEPNADMPGGVDRRLGNMVAELRLILAELQDLSIAARPGLPARGLGGPSLPRLLPGDAVTAGSAAAGGSAVRSGEVPGAGSKPPGLYPGDGADARPVEAAAAPGAPSGEASDDRHVSEAGAQITGTADYGFRVPMPPRFEMRPWGPMANPWHWPGTREIARQVAANAARGRAL